MPKTTKEYNCECGCHITEGNPLSICQHCDYANKWFSQSEVDEMVKLNDDCNYDKFAKCEQEIHEHNKRKLDQLRKDIEKLLPETKVLVNISWLKIQLDDVFSEVKK